MIQLKDYTNPFQAILDFEQAIADYTGAPYCVTTDRCTHALEIAFRLTHIRGEVIIPARTYLSVPMMLHKLGISFTMSDDEWQGEYAIPGTRIWDCARRFDKNMYRPGTVQCISFGITKPLEIGLGGCLLTDNRELYKSASRMRMDGRDVFKYSPWIEQGEFEEGYHYYLRPEECVRGLNMLNARQFTAQLPKHYNYPDCRLASITKPKKILL